MLNRRSFLKSLAALAALPIAGYVAVKRRVLGPSIDFDQPCEWRNYTMTYDASDTIDKMVWQLHQPQANERLRRPSPEEILEIKRCIRRRLNGEIDCFPDHGRYWGINYWLKMTA